MEARNNIIAKIFGNKKSLEGDDLSKSKNSPDNEATSEKDIDAPVIIVPEGQPTAIADSQEPKAEEVAETPQQDENLPVPEAEAPVTPSQPVSTLAFGPEDTALTHALRFLEAIVKCRLDLHFQKTQTFPALEFSFVDDGSPFAQYVMDHKLSIEELLLVLLALSPHVHANFFYSIIQPYLPGGGDFPEFGGVRGSQYRGIMPTGETALFLLAGAQNLQHRFDLMRWFTSGECKPFALKTLHLDASKDAEPDMSARLVFSPEKVVEFLTGAKWRPTYSPNFPASLQTTGMDWEDLVLPNDTMRELDMIRYWLEQHKAMESDRRLAKRVKPGYRALFHGLPGTGKTLTATLLGKQFGLDVFRIDLSMIVSKYIGETEKNLQFIFDKAAHKNWILFFDEADALFGKRTNVQSSNDRFANQEVSYLLQKVEDHSGLVILATNLKSNLDQAFMRRFQSVVFFQLPNEAERLRLWQNTLPESIELDPEVNLQQMARQYELSGASIVNIVHAASLKALAHKRFIAVADLKDEIRKEYFKDGKTAPL